MTEKEPAKRIQDTKAGNFVSCIFSRLLIPNSMPQHFRLIPLDIAFYHAKHESPKWLRDSPLNTQIQLTRDNPENDKHHIHILFSQGICTFLCSNYFYMSRKYQLSACFIYTGWESYLFSFECWPCQNCSYFLSRWLNYCEVLHKGWCGYSIQRLQMHSACVALLIRSTLACSDHQSLDEIPDAF